MKIETIKSNKKNKNFNKALKILILKIKTIKKQQRKAKTSTKL
jgi:hypothetical protein